MRYDYQCTTCGHEFEAVQSMKDVALVECPQCKGEIHRKLVAPTLIVRGGDNLKSGHYRQVKSTEAEMAQVFGGI